MSAASPRIVDLVFAREVPRARLRAGVAVGLTIVAYAALAGVVFGTRLSLETWSADIAARVHAELSNQDTIELAPPPPAPPPLAPPLPPPVAEMPPPPSRVAPPRAARAAPPSPPAQAARIVAREPDPNAPVDLTGDTFVTGTAATYAGGATASTGTSARAVPLEALGSANGAGAARSVAAPSRARPVSLDEPDWRCPWPREADAEAIDEQTATVRVVVAAGGQVEATQLVADPGHGFGAAALDCARRARYVAALDAAGHAVRATSPPIRVHFLR